VPGNLEATLILPEHAYGVKKNEEKTLIPQGFLDQRAPNRRPPQAGVKGAEGGEANPCARRTQAARRSRQWTTAPAHAGALQECSDDGASWRTLTAGGVQDAPQWSMIREGRR